MYAKYNKRKIEKFSCNILDNFGWYIVHHDSVLVVVINVLISDENIKVYYLFVVVFLALPFHWHNVINYSVQYCVLFV